MPTLSPNARRLVLRLRSYAEQAEKGHRSNAAASFREMASMVESSKMTAVAASRRAAELKREHR
ncbi:MAG: hypothetical protein QM754_18420 [Tepidisphaeraceae bacterium]